MGNTVTRSAVLNNSIVALRRRLFDLGITVTRSRDVAVAARLLLGRGYLADSLARLPYDEAAQVMEAVRES